MSSTSLELAEPPWIVGHRGASADAPENTLDSLRLAVEQGADMVELDLRLTADEHLVVFHDSDLERLTGASGRIEELTLAELAEHRVEGAPIPSLEEVFDALPAEFPLNLELKLTYAEPKRLVAAVIEAIEDRANLLISSFQTELLAGVRALAPEVPLAPLAKRDVQQLLAAARELGAYSVHCHRKIATHALISAAASFGWPVLVYTVDDRETASELLALGASGLFSNRPGALRRELAVPA